jgi:putative transposase
MTDETPAHESPPVSKKRRRHTAPSSVDYGLYRWDGLTRYLDDGGVPIDNFFVERLWRGVKYEDVYLRTCEPANLRTCGSIAAARASLGQYFAFFNTERRHQSLDRRTPDGVYDESAVRLRHNPRLCHRVDEMVPCTSGRVTAPVRALKRLSPSQQAGPGTSRGRPAET